MHVRRSRGSDPGEWSRCFGGQTYIIVRMHPSSCRKLTGSHHVHVLANVHAVHLWLVGLICNDLFLLTHISSLYSSFLLRSSNGFLYCLNRKYDVCSCLGQSEDMYSSVLSVKTEFMRTV